MIAFSIELTLITLACEEGSESVISIIDGGLANWSAPRGVDSAVSRVETDDESAVLALDDCEVFVIGDEKLAVSSVEWVDEKLVSTVDDCEILLVVI
jgi:hypothetical protein